MRYDEIQYQETTTDTDLDNLRGDGREQDLARHAQFLRNEVRAQYAEIEELEGDAEEARSQVGGCTDDIRDYLNRLSQEIEDLVPEDLALAKVTIDLIRAELTFIDNYLEETEEEEQ